RGRFRPGFVVLGRVRFGRLRRFFLLVLFRIVFLGGLQGLLELLVLSEARQRVPSSGGSSWGLSRRGVRRTAPQTRGRRWLRRRSPGAGRGAECGLRGGASLDDEFLYGFGRSDAQHGPPATQEATRGGLH